MSNSEQETDRSAVTTYVPAYQKSAWADHADELGMTQSEFVRTMVQAGRRGFGDTEPDSTQSSDANPRGNVRETVLQALGSNGPLSWEELLETVTDELESQLETALIDLQENGQIGHRPRDGTYTLQDEP
ncbi:DUF5805 domain-containing protein [Halodesulfurarchaeum formicicum]|uniref:Uncharacterized protein n=1 Tax=Halodesulfurarchaeum formicicum TaxID=1873524 RepID=A0A1J1AC48_9EURY|nr:DUF5805 domain-containing protein [Halodesulfurarchaeum formicicum]APE95445.1 hypothetical protein HSR6_0993 [Halodesulfurarchaeum formicicum]